MRKLNKEKTIINGSEKTTFKVYEHKNKIKFKIQFFKNKYSKKKFENYFIEIEKKPLCPKHLNDFFYFFVFEEKLRLMIKSKSFDYYNLPKEKSAEHLIKTSLSYNIKKINEGELKKIKELKIFRDEYSRLNYSELIKFMSNEDVIKTKNSLKEITFNKEKTIKLERIVYRWYIRGLVLENAIKKVINEYNLSLNIIKNRNKNKKKNKSTIKII